MKTTILIICGIIFITLFVILVVAKMTSSPLEKPVYTYFFYYKKENIIKIGFSINPIKRCNDVMKLCSLIDKTPIELIILKILPINIEKSLHGIFKSDYINKNNMQANDWLGNDFKFGTEWFKNSQRLQEFIKDIK